ncbi:MAG: Gfo/Idh/MocA family oxidoreductase [Victivallales bacterium]|nr:Gfo/Idh/MocA family oxidoreductase [Victivallales bacterium]
MKVALIGGTGHQGYLLAGLKEMPEHKLIAIAKGTPDEDVSGLFKMTKTALDMEPPMYDDWIRMLDETTPDIVGVSPIFHLHQPISIECLRRGAHVMCEKPVAMSLDALDELEEVWRSSGSKFVGMHAMRYQPNFRALKNALESGMIGRSVLINSQKSYYFSTVRPEFYKRREFFGGTLCWVASHALDWSHWYMGAVKSINAYHTTVGNKGYGTCESSGVISCCFENGGVGCVNFDFLKAGKDDKARDACRIAGEKGVLEAYEGKAYIVTHDEPKRELTLPPEESFFKTFVDSVKGTGECLLDAKETFAVTRLCLLARESADHGGEAICVDGR